MDSTETVINQLIEKAGESTDSNDALKFTQAACNAANAWQCVAYIKREFALMGAASSNDAPA